MKHHLQGEMRSRRVSLDGKELLPGPSQAVMNHSPDGFCWGYGGSGPAQLALAVCLKIGKRKSTALRVYQEFKRQVICNLAADFDVEFLWDSRWCIARYLHRVGDDFHSWAFNAPGRYEMPGPMEIKKP